MSKEVLVFLGTAALGFNLCEKKTWSAVVFQYCSYICNLHASDDEVVKLSSVFEGGHCTEDKEKLYCVCNLQLHCFINRKVTGSISDVVFSIFRLINLSDRTVVIG